VKLALRSLLPQPPALVVSGINLGPNLGINVFYSGTVAGAIEAAAQEIPALAISLATFEQPHFATAGRVARDLARRLLAEGLPRRTLLNVNVPNRPYSELSGFRVTGHGFGRYDDGYRLSWNGSSATAHPESYGYLLLDPADDDRSVREGHVTITPLSLDLTAEPLIPLLRRWPWPPTTHGTVDER